LFGIRREIARIAAITRISRVGDNTGAAPTDVTAAMRAVFELVGAALATVIMVVALGGCKSHPTAPPAAPQAMVSPAGEAGATPAKTPAAPLKLDLSPFNFQISSGADQYQIEGFIARTKQPGRLPAVLVLNGDKGNARRCIENTGHFTEMGIQVACISLPGYGKSSGPSRFVGAQSVAAARRALDLLAARPDVDPARMAVWGMADGAVAAGLLMDSDPRPRAVILQSGAYDMLKLWPEAPLGTKLSILRQVWPSKRVLRERSVIENLPAHLDCSVLILHGVRDRPRPIDQAEQLAEALAERGAHVETHYFPKGAHELGRDVDLPLRNFLRDNLIAPPAADESSAPIGVESETP
jgi:alpha-beta hydrolase superfamily lysophospholipase